MAENITPNSEEPAVEETEETPEVEAHAAEVLGLQGVGIDGSETGVVDPAAGSCSSCIGSTCF